MKFLNVYMKCHKLRINMMRNRDNSTYKSEGKLNRTTVRSFIKMMTSRKKMFDQISVPAITDS